MFKGAQERAVLGEILASSISDSVKIEAIKYLMRGANHEEVLRAVREINTTLAGVKGVLAVNLLRHC